MKYEYENYLILYIYMCIKEKDLQCFIKILTREEVKTALLFKWNKFFIPVRYF